MKSAVVLLPGLNRDRDMIAALQRDGVLSREHEVQLEEALKSSRTIGAAVGIIMGTRQVSEDVAFDMLKAASNHSNRKLREIAADAESERTVLDGRLHDLARRLDELGART